MARDLVVSKVNGSNFVGLDIVTRAASVAVDAVQRFRRKKTVRSTRFALFVNGRGGGRMPEAGSVCWWDTHEVQWAAGAGVECYLEWTDGICHCHRLPTSTW